MTDRPQSRPYRAVTASRTLTLLAVLCFSADVAALPPSVGTDAPNVVLILADDIGVETIGAYGSGHDTPSIDALAAGGVRYANAYATPLCTPSRVRMLTGKYGYRNYVTFAHLDPAEYTFAEMLRDAGYATLIAGKWQLAGNGVDGHVGSMPSDAGFDEHLAWYFERSRKGARYWQPTFINDGVRHTYCPGDFGPDLLNERVLEFIGREPGQPFFVMYSMLLAHTPWVSPPGGPDGATDQERFAAMLGYMDGLVGRLVQRLEELNVLDETLIMFIGDNGTTLGMPSRRHGVTVTGSKGYPDDAGIHVPFIMHWPKELPAGRVSHDLVDIMDVFPTLAEATGLSAPADLDGINLLDYVADDAPEFPRDAIFMHYDSRWQHPPHRLIFDARWKLYGDGRFIDTHADPLERAPLDPDALVGESARVHERFSARLAAMNDGELTEPPRPDSMQDIRQEPTLECGPDGKAIRPPFAAPAR